MGIVLDRCGEEGVDLKGKAFNLPVELWFNPHPHLVIELWLVTERIRLQIQAAQRFLCRVSGLRLR